MNPYKIDFNDFKAVITNDGFTVIPFLLYHWKNVFTEYEWNDIKKDDIVIDIGACVGAFSLRAAQFSNHVFAIEPLFMDELKQNLA